VQRGGTESLPQPDPQGPEQRALRASAFDGAPWPILVLSANGLLKAANEAAEMLFGQALATLSRRGLSEATRDGELMRLFDRAVAEDGFVHQGGVEVCCPGVITFEAEVTFSPLPSGDVLATFYLESQGTKRERASEALRSVAGMGRTLAHEIKNPLAGIRGAAQLLKSGASPADAPLAQVIVEETDRIRRLVDQVEAFSDERTAARVPLNIHRILDRVRMLSSSAFDGQVAFQDSYDPSLPMVLGDEDQLVQIFLNLVKNAAEAALERRDLQGQVRISTAYRMGSRLRTAGQGWLSAPLEVRIQDNGPGVPPDLRHRLFDAFVTTKLSGMGLGLTLVAKLVHAHDGLIEFESEPGRTVFHVLLPIAVDAS